MGAGAGPGTLGGAQAVIASRAAALRSLVDAANTNTRLPETACGVVTGHDSGVVRRPGRSLLGPIVGAPVPTASPRSASSRPRPLFVLASAAALAPGGARPGQVTGLGRGRRKSRLTTHCWTAPTRLLVTQ
jgi:hypothetical protein